MSLETDYIKEEKEFVDDFLGFLNGSPSQFHAVAQAKKMLNADGFVQISEKDAHAFNALKAGGKYYFTRNQSTILAFAVGGKYQPGNGFNIMAAHTDSPVLKVKPISKITKFGYQQVGVETYGGGLWNTWFDRDLSIAGRVIVAGTNGDEATYTSKLVDVSRPILSIPSLAIHLNREIRSKGFQFNPETNLCPVLATTAKATLNAPVAAAGEKKAKEEGIAAEHHPLLLQIVAQELNITVDEIRDFELCLYDTQKAGLGGALNEFIFARGLDNLGMSYICMRSLIDSCADASLENESQIRLVGLFDNEEVGSQSQAGAASSLMIQTLKRIVNAGVEADAVSALPACVFDASIRKSVLVSADMAHGIHPNWSEKHEKNHAPAMHKGLVIKQNVNQRYATNCITTFLLSEIAKKHSIDIQKFVVRNDCPCGSTIGPILSSRCGIRTVDVGNPMLGMHSIRESCGTHDSWSSYKLFTAFFREFSSLDLKLDADE